MCCAKSFPMGFSEFVLPANTCSCANCSPSCTMSVCGTNQPPADAAPFVRAVFSDHALSDQSSLQCSCGVGRAARPRRICSVTNSPLAWRASARRAHRGSAELSVKFWDSSALVPLIIEERHSKACRQLLGDDPTQIV